MEIILSSCLLVGVVLALGALCLLLGYPVVALIRKGKQPLSSALVLGEGLFILIAYLVSRVGLALELWSLLPPLLVSFGFFLATLRRDRFSSIRRLTIDDVLCLIAPLITAAFVIYLVSSANFFDACGTGDFSAYWATAEYLQHFPLSQELWFQQQTFHHQEAELHLTYYGRIGVMTLFGALTSLLGLSTPVPLFIPLIVFNQFLLCTLLREFVAEKIGNQLNLTARSVMNKALPFIISASPLVYFNLYYSYLSQAVALPLITLSLISVGNPLERKNCESLIPFYLLISATSLVYEALIPLVLAILCLVAGLDLLIAIWHRASIPALATKLLGPVIFLLFCADNLFIALRRMLFVGNKGSFPGWDWDRVPSITDIVGLTSPVAYKQAVSLGSLLLPVELILFGVCLFGLSRIRFALALSLPFLYSLAIYAFSYLHILRATPNATHMVAKSLATFSPIIVVTFVIGVGSIAQRIRKESWGLVLFLIVIALQAFHLRYLVPQKIVVSDSQLSLLRNWADRGFTIRFSSSYRSQASIRMNFGPAVRSDSLLDTFSEEENCGRCPTVGGKTVWICEERETSQLYARECDGENSTHLEF